MLDGTGQQDLLDALPMASVILDEHGTILAANRRWRSFARENGGDTVDYYVGRDYLAICHSASGASSTEAVIVEEGLRRVIAGNGTFRCEYPCHSRDEMRWFELFAGPLHLGGRHLVIVSHSNITSRRLQQDEVAASRINASELAALVASSTDAIMSYDLDGRVLTWNRAASDLYGYTPDEAIGQSMEIIYPDDWPVRITEYRDRIISGEMTRFEVLRKTKSGAMRDIAISASPVRDDSGAVVAISNFHRDVTEQKATEERLRFITHELRHRTKNMLAIIGAIERQTARRNETIEGFHKDFSSRLDALAAANDLLVSKAWRPVSLEELCRSQMNLFSDRHADRVRIGGPPVAMDANAVEAIGLSLHELATNALKYGALAGHGGSVELAWEFVGPDDERRLRFVWHERCGAITPGPHKNGFGHAVVTGVAAQKLGAEVSHEFGDGELVWSAMIPSERVTVEA